MIVNKDVASINRAVSATWSTRSVGGFNHSRQPSVIAVITPSATMMMWSGAYSYNGVVLGKIRRFT